MVILSLVNAFVEPNEFVVGFLSLVSNLAKDVGHRTNRAYAQFFATSFEEWNSVLVRNANLSYLRWIVMSPRRKVGKIVYTCPTSKFSGWMT